MARVDGLIFPAPSTGQPELYTLPSEGEPCGLSWYRRCVDALGVRERFPQPDWSIVDYRVACLLLHQGWGAAPVADILRQGSPGFPRRHAHPEDYLRRTVQAAARALLRHPVFSRAPVRLSHT